MVSDEVFKPYKYVARHSYRREIRAHPYVSPAIASQDGQFKQAYVY